MAIIPLFGVIGLVSDIGYMHYTKMAAQTAAEAAAHATIIDLHSSNAASSYTCGTTGSTVKCSSTQTGCPSSITTPANSVEHGCMYAMQHGFTNTGNQSVTYTAGVSSVPGTASGTPSASYWVTFYVTQKVPQLFSAVLGNTTGMVAARSTASLIGAADCIYALNKTASGAVSAGGSSGLTSSCGVFVNSNSSSALSTNGGGSITATEYDIVGKGPGYSGTFTPKPTTGVAPISDPLAGMAVPKSGPYVCDYTNYSASNWSNPTLSPGVYCGGISVGNNTYTLSTGTYTLVGGGLSTQNANSVLKSGPGGVLIYNTYDSTHSFSPISLSGNSSVTLAAMTTGSYAGILYFEDRTAPASAESFVGGSGAGFTGVIYAKNAAVTMVGNTNVNAYTILIADTITFTGTSSFNNDYSLLPNGNPVERIAVVE